MRTRGKTINRAETRRFTRIAAAALMATNLMPLKDARADEQAKEQPKQEQEDSVSLSVRAKGGVYDMAETPFVGLGLTAGYDAGLAAFTLIADGMFSKFETLELDHAELDITFPITSWMEITPYIYRSRYYDVDLGIGGAVSFPDVGLHMAPEWCCKELVPIAVFWTPSFADGKVNAVVKPVVIANHSALAEPAPILGGELALSVEVANSVGLYVKAFEMSLREGSEWSIAVMNAQAGVEISR